MTIETAPKEALKMDPFISFVLKQIKEEAHTSDELLQSGAKTALAQTIQTFFEDPFTFKIDALKFHHRAVAELVDRYVITFFKAKDDKLVKVFRHPTVTGCNYFLILKEDTTENREVFFELLDYYQTLKINAILPINLTFLPQETIGKFELEEVALT